MHLLQGKFAKICRSCSLHSASHDFQLLPRGVASPVGRLQQLQSQLRQVSSQPFEAQLAEEMGNEADMGGVPQMGDTVYPKKWMLYKGNSQSKMDDDWSGYPHLWKPRNDGNGHKDREDRDGNLCRKDDDLQEIIPSLRGGYKVKVSKLKSLMQISKFL